jgi:hypothetical protein
VTRSHVPTSYRREADRRPRSASCVPGALAALLLGLAGIAAPPEARATQPGFAFLEIPTGARAAALGGAYASVAEGTESMFWNAAGLSEARGLQVVGGHSELLERLRSDHFAIGGRAWSGGIAASIRALYSDPIEERDELGTLIGTFGAHDLEFALGYGHRLGGGVSIGGTAQVVRERIANLAATTYGFGFGASFEPSTLPGVKLGLSAQNLGPAAHYTIDGSAGAPVGMPAAVQAGASYLLGLGSRYRLRASAETRVASGRSAMGFVGSELEDPRGAALRLGMRFNDTSTALSFGAGYALSSLKLDYAFVPLREDLGNTHRIAFTAQF